MMKEKEWKVTFGQLGGLDFKLNWWALFNVKLEIITTCHYHVIMWGNQVHEEKLEDYLVGLLCWRDNKCWNIFLIGLLRLDIVSLLDLHELLRLPIIFFCERCPISWVWICENAKAPLTYVRLESKILSPKVNAKSFERVIGKSSSC